MHRLSHRQAAAALAAGALLVLPVASLAGSSASSAPTSGLAKSYDMNSATGDYAPGGSQVPGAIRAAR
jgi:hypothetical protein